MSGPGRLPRALPFARKGTSKQWGSREERRACAATRVEGFGVRRWRSEINIGRRSEGRVVLKRDLFWQLNWVERLGAPNTFALPW
jgi:hypothetical protein